MPIPPNSDSDLLYIKNINIISLYPYVSLVSIFKEVYGKEAYDIITDLFK